MATLTSGVQTPRIMHVPDYVSSAGQEAVELCAMAGLDLDPWQQTVLSESLGETKDGKWAAFEVGLCCPRQNGKDGILEGRELAGLFLLGERLIIHSAHQFDTSLEHFRRLLFLIENTPELDSRVQRVSRAHGEEGIELRGGQRIRFRTRTKGGGRGFTGDLLILNEAMIVSETSHGALLPTLSARPNPQVWYTGSAVDQLVHEDGVVFARVRERGIKGEDQRLAYFEWSADAEAAGDVDAGMANDPKSWAQANPALGIRISEEHVASEHSSMDPRMFAVERLGVGDWPATDGSTPQVISLDDWMKLEDGKSSMLDPVCLAFDVSPDRSSSSISAAGVREDGLLHTEVVERGPGTGWVVRRIAALKADHGISGVLCSAASPAASLISQCDAEGITVTAVSSADEAKACGVLFDLVEQQGLRHLGTSDLAAAVRGATKRPLGDAWAWSRKTSAVDISPLVACTLAVWGAATLQVKKPPVVVMA